MGSVSISLATTGNSKTHLPGRKTGSELVVSCLLRRSRLYVEVQFVFHSQLRNTALFSTLRISCSCTSCFIVHNLLSIPGNIGILNHTPSYLANLCLLPGTCLETSDDQIENVRRPFGEIRSGFHLKHRSPRAESTRPCPSWKTFPIGN